MRTPELPDDWTPIIIGGALVGSAAVLAALAATLPVTNLAHRLHLTTDAETLRVAMAIAAPLEATEEERQSAWAHLPAEQRRNRLQEARAAIMALRQGS